MIGPEVSQCDQSGDEYEWDAGPSDVCLTISNSCVRNPLNSPSKRRLCPSAGGAGVSARAMNQGHSERQTDVA